MKVTKTQGQPVFQPIELKITIESAEELRVLKDITGNNHTNALALKNGGTIGTKDVTTTSLMFAEVYNSLSDV